MHPDFESNLTTTIFRKFGVGRITRSDDIFAFVRGTKRVSYSFVLNACLSTHLLCSFCSVFIIDANL